MAAIQMGQSYGADTEEVKDSTFDEEEGEDTQDASSASEDEPGSEPETEEETPEVEEETTDDSTDEPDDEQVVTALTSEKERLLKEISDLRTERRSVRESKKEEPLFIESQTDELADVNPQDAELIEKVLRAKGYVKKDELNALTYKEKLDAHKDQWLQAHPEYLPANDPDDTNWNALTTTLNGYFKTPANPADIVKMLDVAHGMVKPSSSIPTKSRASADAANEKIKISSKGASAGGASKPIISKSKGTIDRSAFHGFSDEELAELGY